MPLGHLTDLVLKVGGVLALVGSLLGAWLTSSTTCTSSLVSTQSCRNVFGDVALNAVGEPDLVPLFLSGAFGGAVLGAVLGLGIAMIWPSTKDRLL